MENAIDVGKLNVETKTTTQHRAALQSVNCNLNTRQCCIPTRCGEYKENSPIIGRRNVKIS